MKKPGKKSYSQIFPRYHQLSVVRTLLADAQKCGAGKRYLIQHSAGSGKSNSIAWLSHQLVGLEHDRKALFDSVIVVTDRRVLDKQICNTIRHFAQVPATVGHARHSGDLKNLLKTGKKIIITTVQKFPHILDEISHLQSKFAIIIDEAHSSQGGKATAAMNRVLKGDESSDEETTEDKINAIIESRRMLPNVNYFAFTATPKNKTLELFGTPYPQADGPVKHYPFHSYTMKQAIQEGFILDVLKNYTPIQSYYRLTRTIEDDPLFDAKKAHKKLHHYVESHEHAIREKARIMIDHFHNQVIGKHKIDGQARAMVLASGIKQAIRYFHAFRSYLKERKSPYAAIVAFSGEHEDSGKSVGEATLNGFPGNQISGKMQHDPLSLPDCG